MPHQPDTADLARRVMEAAEKAKSATKDRASQSPGGLECISCGVIFVGDTSHDECGQCDAYARFHLDAITAVPALAQAVLEKDAEIERLREALEWAFPLAVMTMEDHRTARVKAGHKMTGTYRSGTTYVGIYQDEVDQIERHRDTLNAATQARTALKDKTNG